MSNALRLKGEPDGIAKTLGVFEMGNHSVKWYKQNDGWHVVIQHEAVPDGPAMSALSNHQDPLKAYEEFKRVVRSIMTTTPAADII